MFFRNLICIAGVVCICLHFQSCNEKSSGYEIGDSGFILNPQLKKISGFDSLSFHSVPVMLTDVKFKAEKAAPNLVIIYLYKFRKKTILYLEVLSRYNHIG